VNQSTIPPPTLSISKNHVGNFPPGQQNATYTVVVSNASSAGPTNAPVTVIENLPNGLALVLMSGTGWSCSTNTCNRSDVLNAGAGYPAITVTVNVATNATSPQVNQVTVSGGGSVPASASDLTLIRSAQPKLTVNHTSLNFAYSGPPILATSVLQTVLLSITDAGPNVGWTATPSQSNILFAGAVYPRVSGVGSGSFQVGAGAGPSGTIIVTLTNAIGSVTIQVNVTKADPSPPFGSFDTPLDNTTGIAGAIPVTGWALDTVEVVGVRIYREPNPNESGLMFIGDATFVEDARPDVAAKYSNMPNQYSAGWGYMMLTNFLPSNNGATGLGNGTYRLHAIATNTFGTQTDLGTRTITVDNAHAKKPFGTIDTPSQGGTVSGGAYVNFGWALTQNPNVIPIDGSTLTVYVDGMPVGHPTYNQYRSDIATLFPGVANSNGAVGFYYIDTSKLANGVHSIAWSVYDNANRGDGIGSRYFSVLNTGTQNVPAMDKSIELQPNSAVMFRHGFNHNSTQQKLAADASGAYSIDMEEVSRIELQVGATTGYLLLKGERRQLPIGSSLNDGVFYWQAGLGFLGEYELLFERPDAALIRVRVVIHPKSW
jgi:uncharacterized repeat protein (TIGR01451 family)